MRHDVRKSERHPIWGMAALVGDRESLVGQVVNISGTGIALNLNHDRNASGSLRNTWLCRVVSPDFPETLEFVAKVVRRYATTRGSGVGCTIAAINDKDMAMIDDFQRRRRSLEH
ncbi:PilZ domain-containing protein [Azospira restricta]|uniref:PilZ domain-containing protein n=1 Tax=Azospira restricta TaxID=404405 RepID=A0A974PVC8_9RHOO|nr:PilZ domain-containing protein [Azospira restricta]QRJ62203.1 PilZ domain-containing protein [Azospira restricta]